MIQYNSSLFDFLLDSSQKRRNEFLFHNIAVTRKSSEQITSPMLVLLKSQNRVNANKEHRIQ